MDKNLKLGHYFKGQEPTGCFNTGIAPVIARSRQAKKYTGKEYIVGRDLDVLYDMTGLILSIMRGKPVKAKLYTSKARAFEEFEQWENIGRGVMREYYEEHPEKAEEDGHDVEDGEVKYLDEVLDNYEPMMNYAYLLRCEPDRDDVLRVCQETNLTVMYKDSEEEYYLALTGGGMDLSQDIARAYQILDTWLPTALLREVCKQPELSVHGEAWLEMAEQIRKQMMMEIRGLAQDYKQWGSNIQEYKIKAKERANA